MPEYLAPGVYVEEVSFRSKSIEGVSTTTTGFVGPVRYGPVTLQPDVLTSIGDFEQVYGDRQQLAFASPDPSPMHNYSWHGVRAFFTEGGSRLYFSRTFRNLDNTTYEPPDDTQPAPAVVDQYNDGHARGAIGTLLLRARFPGAYGNLRVRITVTMSQDALNHRDNSVAGLVNRDVVLLGDATASPPNGTFYIAMWDSDAAAWRFQTSAASTSGALTVQQVASHGWSIRIAKLTLTVFDPTGGPSKTYAGLAPDPQHTSSGLADSLTAYFAPTPSSSALEKILPIVLLPPQTADGVAIMNLITTASPGPGILDFVESTASTDLQRSVDVVLKGGNDGRRPSADDYEGKAEPDVSFKTGLCQFEDIDDISIVAAPGSTFLLEGGYHNDATAIISLLIAHCEKMRYRIAVLDCGDGESIQQVRKLRGTLDSSWAALYYPWVRVLDPVTRGEIFLPPSGFVSGIYARNDINRAVYKAPANEPVILSQGFEVSLNKAQQEVLNPEGVNCFRFFEGRGYRLWGARTASSDPEWKYVNLRRYFAYLEHSIDKGTQWAVFEPNGPHLWDNIRHTISDFLLNEYQNGALLGDKPEKAFFVRCDRSTMTQNDLDNGRLVALIGVSPLRPAEFVIFRIGQITADTQ